ncbi:Mu-like prophage major head subunit gpT family protein [Acinetobacter pittii]|uniref:Mu-like prophage major head subunit gpT family protein n=1 Tax=Acinetobacter pittii TaxID=48296 RepID=UPI0019001C57|nr:Mu-like prophage major head subunit gpT family protein [Acinetobacter pittii]MBJ8502287.1 Mu-like prophage major head subunit gpT family protein [Acinetobacter pittii]MBJ9892719.1 Mu-like prophage major head subunit gpT family protein [Acinetobacter pittii]
MKFTAQNAKQVLAHLFTGFKTTFNKSFTETETTWQRIATEVPSQSKAENYAWLGKFPKLREWIGDKVIKRLEGYGYTITNRSFESTVSVHKHEIQDGDILGLPIIFASMGEEAKQFPQDVVFEALTTGFENKCFDGKTFYATNHPVGDKKGTTFSNKLTAKLSWASLAEAEASFGEAKTMMTSLKDENGRSLKIKPDLLVVPPALEATATALMTSSKFADGTENIYKGNVEVLVDAGLATDTEWHLLSTKKVIKPIIWQIREKANLVSQTDIESGDVFKRGEYLFGVEARGEAGYSLPHLAVGSTGTGA